MIKKEGAGDILFLLFLFVRYLTFSSNDFLSF